MKGFLALAALIVFTLGATQTKPFSPSSPAQSIERLAVPPPMPRRSISPSTNAPAGESVLLEDKGVKFMLFIPTGWVTPASGAITLVAHFHTTIWFVIQEHLRRKCQEPLICFQLGEGSTVYRQPFEDTNRFGRVLRLVEQELRKRGAPAGSHITAVDVSSFSAGYGAVRELIKSADYFQIIRRIVLLDSMYAGFEEPSANQTQRKPAFSQIEVWASFARAAVQGEKTFVLTHSAVPTTNYASSSECSSALLALLAISRQPVAVGSLAAASEAEFPLLSRADSGNLHIWAYGGEDAQA